MKRSMTLLGISLVLAMSWSSPTVRAFCGFYVAKADAKLFNKASQVVLVRRGDKTVITMANDFQGDPTEFAVVVPVPTFIERGQIHVTNKALIDHLDAFTAPRLVEYFDENPCMRYVRRELALPSSAQALGEAGRRNRADALGVSIEASYTVGEYDIVILSAEQSDGLTTWLTENGYRIPPGASRVLASYIRQNVRFFVAKVNLEEQSPRVQLSTPDTSRFRVSEVHAAHPPRYAQRERSPGSSRLRAHAERTRGDDQLSNGQASERDGSPRLRETGVRRFLQSHVRRASAQGEHAERVSRICMGHVLVRPVRGRSSIRERAA